MNETNFMINTKSIIQNNKMIPQPNKKPGTILISISKSISN